MGKTLAISGHRLHTLGLPQDENGPAITALKRDMAAHIDRLIQEEGVTRVIVGGAIGVDTWAAEMILERMKSNPILVLELAVPFENHTEKWNSKSLISYRERYEAIVASGKLTVKYTPDEKYDSKTSYQRRNRYLAETCDYLLAVWTGKNSGTSMTYRMAMDASKICTIIDPRNYRVLVNTEE